MTPSYSDGEGGCVGLEISTKHVTFTSIESKLFSYAKVALHPCPPAPKGITLCECSQHKKGKDL